MQIVEYDKRYLEDVRTLLVELEEYIVSVDRDNLDHIHPEYREKMALFDLEEVKQNNGKCFLAMENDQIVGLIMGTIPKYSKKDYLDYKCPKRGIITELVISKDYRKSGIGKKLIKQIEEYFMSQKCEYAMTEVFAYNENAIKFYDKNGYHTRMLVNIKKL